MVPKSRLSKITTSFQLRTAAKSQEVVESYIQMRQFHGSKKDADQMLDEYGLRPVKVSRVLSTASVHY